MGNTNKLELTFHGKPLLQHVIDAALASALSPLLLVTGPGKSQLLSKLPGRIKLVINPNPDAGYASSLQAGLHTLKTPCNGAMFLLADQPLVTTATINTLISAFVQEPERWVAPSYNGKRGNPVITPAAWFPEIHALKGDTGPREHLKNPAARLHLIQVNDPGVIFDVDTPESYQQLIYL